jgi:hypothetical protein
MFCGSLDGEHRAWLENITLRCCITLISGFKTSVKTTT